MNRLRWLNPHGWPGAIFLTILTLSLSVPVFLTIDNATALLLSLTAFMLTKTAVAYLICRAGGWRRPEGFFIVAYSLIWSFYVGYIVAFLYTGGQITEVQRDVLFALMFTSATMSFITFPWLRTRLAEKERRLDERSAQQDQRGVRQDRRGEGQDERAKLLTKRTASIDTRSDAIGVREGAADVRDHDADAQRQADDLARQETLLEVKEKVDEIATVVHDTPLGDKP